MKLHFRTAISAALLLVLTASAARAQTATQQTATDPYLSWSGEAYKWPAAALSAPALVSVPVTDADGNSLHELHIRGDGLDIALGIGSMGPFCVNPATPTPSIRAGSLILSDSRAGNGVLCISHFAKGAFLPSAGKDTLMGVAKALMEQNNPNTGVKVEIVDAPSELGRKDLLMMARPVFLTWHLTDPSTKSDLLCTDYFFNLSDGSLLVVSAVAQPGNHPALRAHAEQMMRFSSIVNKDEDKKEPPAKQDNTEKPDKAETSSGESQS